MYLEYYRRAKRERTIIIKIINKRMSKVKKNYTLS